MTEKEKDIYFLKRKKSKVTLTQLAKVLGCSETWISRFENEPYTQMSHQKMFAYRQYIDQHSKR